MTALPGGNGVLTLHALTLREGSTGLELYAALRNDGDKPACHAALAVELFDKQEQSLAAGISGLLSSRFYQVTPGPEHTEMLATCIAPGDTTMAAVSDLAKDVPRSAVAHIVYRCPYFALDVRPIAGLEITQLQRSAQGPYTGVLHNGLTHTLHNPSVSVFPTARSGRPLGMVSTSSAITLAPGEDWRFETSETGAIDAAAVDQQAYPAGALQP